MAPRRGFKQLKLSDRLKIEALLRGKHSKKEIAEILHVHRSTIYNEIKRGQYEHTNSDYTTEMRYSPDLAQQRCEENLKARGKQLKIGNDLKLANYIEDKIINEKYSPAAVIGEIKAQGRENEFKTMICTKTLYNYIDKGVFFSLTNKDLPVKSKKKRRYKKVRVQKRAAAGTSIEKRPPEIDTREEFGNWEMDTVLGARGKGKHSLLVLTERKTRDEIIYKLEEHTAAAVVERIDELETEYGENFKKVFKTITVDNGTEFAYAEQLEQSILTDGKRINLYYCHPYSSYERGTNENTNKLIRRMYPKGAIFDGVTDEEIEALTKWINNYPREIFGFHTAKEMFDAELAAIK